MFERKNGVKIYFPDGHLEKPVWDAMIEAGYKLKKSERGYHISVDHPEIILKQVRPQIMPFYIMRGRGDGGFTGEDILENSMLRYEKLNEKVVVVERLPFRPTKLVVAVSEEMYPGVKTIEDLKEVAGDKELMFASEFPDLAKKYCEEKGLNAIVFDPIGKTEASILPPDPEADLILEITEFGTTLRENGCRIIDVVKDPVYSVFIANKESYSNPHKRKLMENLITDIKEVLDSRNLVSFLFNVPDENDIPKILEFLTSEGFDPTVSKLAKGGVAIHIIIDRSKVKFLKPVIREMGGKRIATQPVISFGE
ncbi:ATP phosphoribosyltransferase (homohexameric) [Archaeoglobus sulfaticallidus PM70-1]|uniref:ATP phosphoribosyltransferase n=1 Tax=Archaeoglobus sulfaticallidus PM70-1 TaxID=387631 RepID=N0BDY6_9EURY|nr:ATP phosphoribosyltransferase [Archaeoglobus sulfaticallidus]AGK61839.1 ATP phosphoribosyltransferase (homohexameric) [Archaeoglobus sulfaticallidus PM70-1]